MVSKAISRILQYLKVLEKYSIEEQAAIMKDFCNLGLILELLPKMWVRERAMDERKDKVSNSLTFIQHTDKDESKDQIQETLNIEEKWPKENQEDSML